MPSFQSLNEFAMVSLVDCDSVHPHASSLSQQADEETAVDQLLVLLKVETSYQVPHIPCRGLSDDSDRLPYGEWRRKICQWAFKVVDHFRLDREVVACALNIFDRYLSVRPASMSCGDECPCPSCQRSIDSRYFQLTAMASLYLAMKLYADNTDESVTSHRRLRLASYVELSRGQFCAEDITAMELTILHDLRWKVHSPTPMTAVSYLLRLMPPHAFIPAESRRIYDLVLHVLHELARYLTELSVCLGDIFTNNSASEIAYAAILVSMDLLTLSALPLDARAAFHEAVESLSTASGGTILRLDSTVVTILQSQLRKSFWPELLTNENGESEAGHPISMARDYGLINVAMIKSSSPRSHSPSNAVKDFEGSPVSVVGRGRGY